jgi:hypothetical protein
VQGAYIGKSEFDKGQVRKQEQAQTTANLAALVCTNYTSDDLPFGFAGTGNVNLAAQFANIGSITGTITGTRKGVVDTVELKETSSTLVWAGASYFGALRVADNGYTGGWKTVFRFPDGERINFPQDQQMLSPLVKKTLDGFDIRFGRFDGIYPGKPLVPQGLHPIYVVQTNERGAQIDNRLEPTGFSLKICGKPAGTP